MFLFLCLTVYPSFKPPLANFDLEDGGDQAIPVPNVTAKGDAKKKKKGRKTVGKYVRKIFQ